MCLDKSIQIVSFRLNPPSLSSMLGSGALETPSRSPQSGVRLRKCLLSSAPETLLCGSNPQKLPRDIKCRQRKHVQEGTDMSKKQNYPERDPKQRCKEYDEDIPGWVLRVPQPSAKIFVEDHVQDLLDRFSVEAAVQDPFVRLFYNVSIKDFHAREIPEKILLAKSLYKISKILLTRSLDEISAQAHTKRAPMARSLQQFFMQDPCPRSLYMTGFLVSWQDLCTRFL